MTVELDYSGARVGVGQPELAPQSLHVGPRREALLGLVIGEV
jgi:hypothetical protein